MIRQRFFCVDDISSMQRQDDEDVLLSKTDSLVSVNLNDPIQAEVNENDVVLLC